MLTCCIYLSYRQAGLVVVGAKVSPSAVCVSRGRFFFCQTRLPLALLCTDCVIYKVLWNGVSIVFHVSLHTAVYEVVNLAERNRV